MFRGSLTAGDLYPSSGASTTAESINPAKGSLPLVGAGPSAVISGASMLVQNAPVFWLLGGLLILGLLKFGFEFGFNVGTKTSVGSS